MSTLPSGTVTFLFTDVEGSTRLLRTLGRERYSEAFAIHSRLLRSAFADWGGVEVDAQGDAFFAAFSRAADGAQAAAARQRALASQPWPHGAQVRVRIGLHTGEATLVNGAYVGLDVHRAARIAQAANGGQVVISQTTRDLLCEELPAGIGLGDLGEHRLKDLLRPQRLYQLLIEGLKTEFGPLRTLEGRPTKLPTQVTALVGRERELAEVIGLLSEGARLVTLTGAGGTGKTRLALQAAAETVEQFAHGTYFVPLAELDDAELVLPTIAQLLGLIGSAEQPLAEAVMEHLRERELLLLLDNFEHLLDSSTVVAELLAAVPRLRCLVTSRAPLRLSGERDYQVPPLALPDSRQSRDPELAAASDAVSLFIERARAVRSDFEPTSKDVASIAEICRQLDGLPLAIELAAARTRILPPAALLGRLEQRLRLLVGGARDLPSRQQTLHGTIEWSYRLLDEQEQRLFAWLGVFASGFGLDAAEAVCDPGSELDFDVFEGIASLVEKALLKREEDLHEEARFSMLRTIREYALQRLELSGEADLMRRRHAEYFLELAERAAVELRGAQESRWLERLGAEHDNLRAALGWCGATGESELQSRIAAALWIYWLAAGYLPEGASWLSQALQAGAAQSPRARMNALLAAASLASARGELGALKIMAEESLGLAEQLSESAAMARSLSLLAVPALQGDDVEQARRLYERSVELARGSGDAWTLAVALNNLGNLGVYEGELERAVEVWEEALAVCRELGNPDLTASVLSNLGFAALARFEEEEAADRFRESLEMFHGMGAKLGISYDLEGLAAVSALRRDAERAARLLGAAGRLRNEMGVQLEPFEEGIHQRSIQLVHRDLSEPRWGASREEGNAMPLDLAVAYALGDGGSG